MHLHEDGEGGLHAAAHDALTHELTHELSVVAGHATAAHAFPRPWREGGFLHRGFLRPCSHLRPSCLKVRHRPERCVITVVYYLRAVEYVKSAWLGQNYH